MKKALLLPLALIATALLLPARADDDVPALSTWGTYKPIKKTEFGHFTYYVHEEGKRRPKKKQVLLQIGESVPLYRDVKVNLNGFKEGQEVFILGHPDKKVTQDPKGGGTVTDYQIQNAIAIVAGDALNLTEGKAVGKLKWLKATVLRTGGGLAVKYEGNDHKVRCAKRWAAMVRVKLEKRPKKIKGMIEVSAQKTEKPKDIKSKADEAFSATQVVILDRRLRKALYPLMLD